MQQSGESLIGQGKFPAAQEGEVRSLTPGPAKFIIAPEKYPTEVIGT